MNRTRSFTSGALVAGLLVSGAVFAQGPRGGGPGGPDGRGFGGPHGGSLPIQALNLTDAQKQQVRDIRQKNRESAREAGERVREAMEAQRRAVETIPLNEGLIRSTTHVLAEAQAEAAIHQARVFSEVWSVLTPDQQAQAKKLQVEREQRMAERRQRMQQRGQQQGNR